MSQVPDYRREGASQAGPLGGNAFQVAVYAGPELNQFGGGTQSITSKVAGRVARYWADLGLTTYTLRYAYPMFRTTIVARANVIPWVTSCSSGNERNPWHFPKGLFQTSLTRGGFGCGFESPEIVRFYRDALAAPDTETAAQVVDGYVDYVHHWALQPGVVAVPDVVITNPLAVSNWDIGKSQWALWALIPAGQP
jgi:hypothetical protein